MTNRFQKLHILFYQRCLWFQIFPILDNICRSTSRFVETGRLETIARVAVVEIAAPKSQLIRTMYRVSR